MSDSNKIKFTVYGDPSAQKRHRSTSRNGKLRQYDPSSDKKGDFLLMCLKNKPNEPIKDKPIRLVIEFVFKRPKSHYGTGKNSLKLKDSAPDKHINKPDIDNLLKFVMDALNGIYWHDDSQIWNVDVSKFYGDVPLTEVTIIY
jgi:Holliday junction resolvase RusA-like endonuclease